VSAEQSARAASPRGAPAFELQHASKSFAGREVLAGLDFCIREGERIAIIGPSGAGKTTLLRLLAGVIAPDSGRVLALGKDTARLSAAQLSSLRREIGVLYQSDNLIPSLRVVHNVLIGRLGSWSVLRALISLFMPRELDRARAALREVEMEARLWDLPGALSGGEQQRIAIARLIVQAPRAMLADEPASSLDQRLGREVIARLSALADKRQATLVVSLHTLDLLGEHFDRILALSAGRIFWQGAVQDLTRGILRDLYGAEYSSLHLDEIEIVDASR
jgi:phosphonate transport system ATP-binding protein